MSTPNVSRNSSPRRWNAIASWLALLVVVVVVFQWRSISQLRQENALFRAQSQAAPPEASSQPVAALSSIQSAFELLGTEAGKGSTAGLQALWRASRIRGLQGFAVRALGQAAGLGNEEALQPLLDPPAARGRGVAEAGLEMNRA